MSDYPCKQVTVSEEEKKILLGAPADAPEDGDAATLKLALMKSKRWPQTGKSFSVSFIDHPEPPAALRTRILSHMNAWSKFCKVSFFESRDDPEVRITLTEKGYWSGVGTDILDVSSFPKDKPTMCLGGFTMDSPEDDFTRVVRHETGHTLGFHHEHLRAEVVNRIDEQKAIEYFGGPYNYWDANTTRYNVLTPLRSSDITATSQADLHSIMCYPIPDSILKSGAQKITGGKDISEWDGQFAGFIYPL
jgi:hypothetical protein